MNTANDNTPSAGVVVPFKPSIDPKQSGHGIGEALAIKIIRLCISTQWSETARAKAGLTAEVLRSQFARLLYQTQQLKRKSEEGDVQSSLELCILAVTLDTFEDDLINKSVLGS